jgi:hypothetical protein
MRKLLCFYVAVVLVGSLYAQDQMSDIESLILSYNQNRSSFGGLTLLKKVDMGIPGGDNWLVECKDNRTSFSTRIFVYVINNGIVTAEFLVALNFDLSEDTDFDIIKDIPGTQIGTGSCVVNDYNGDGFDDIFNYAFLGRGFFIEITWYDLEKNDMAYIEIPFSIVDRGNGPAPVEFISYKGMEGFMVYYYAWTESAKNDRWFFYTWDEKQRKFVEIEEVDPGYVEAYTGPVPIQRQPLPAPPPVATVEEPPIEVAVIAAEQQKETVLAVVEDSAQNGNFVIIIVIIAGVAAAAGVVVFLVVRRKKS